MFILRGRKKESGVGEGREKERMRIPSRLGTGDAESNSQITT